VTVDVILPVLDEAEALPGVLGTFPEGYRPLVVDNGSTDDCGIRMRIPTSSPLTAQHQVQRLRPVLCDVDTVEDACAVAASLPGSRFAAAVRASTAARAA
jgi:hypothetical protein